jgi:predicted DNA-binding WGR domain protein
MTGRYRIYTERRDAARNMARFYSVSIERDFFGGAVLVRRWGRIGTFGRVARHHFAHDNDAVFAFLTLLRTKRLRGYRVTSELPRSA